MQQLEPDDLVLVAILPRRRDLEIARILGWYRIPLKSAPKMVRVDWIAFYLTGDFGEERWSVRYLAPVRGHELIRRGELLVHEQDHPDVDEPYYKIHLGPLQRLEHPIRVENWRRLTFLYTSGKQVLIAQDLKDLTLKGSEGRLLKEASSKGI
jgi:hypothetical protein